MDACQETGPRATGLLETTDGAELYWEESGSPDGAPALYLHGGPGSGLGRGGYRRNFDQERYRLIGLDQRGCGRSTPLVTHDLAGIGANTTQRLIADLEELREHLGVERWLVSGVSWGSTLALAYAEAHPERVSAVVLVAVTTTSRDEVDWITGGGAGTGVGRVFPEAWDAFERASERMPGERVVDAYARRLADPDPAAADDRRAAAEAWDAWESVHISLDPLWSPGPLHPDAAARAVFATLVTHYWAHDGFLRGDDAILARTDRLRGIPGVLVHGRRDVSGPVVTAWRLHRAWPGSELHVVEEDGHGGVRSMEIMREALSRLAAVV